jgi:hypothetical protein
MMRESRPERSVGDGLSPAALIDPRASQRVPSVPTFTPHAAPPRTLNLARRRWCGPAPRVRLGSPPAVQISDILCVPSRVATWHGPSLPENPRTPGSTGPDQHGPGAADSLRDGSYSRAGAHSVPAGIARTELTVATYGKQLPMGNKAAVNRPGDESGSNSRIDRAEDVPKSPEGWSGSGFEPAAYRLRGDSSPCPPSAYACGSSPRACSGERQVDLGTHRDFTVESRMPVLMMAVVRRASHSVPSTIGPSHAPPDAGRHASWAQAFERRVPDLAVLPDRRVERGGARAGPVGAARVRAPRLPHEEIRLRAGAAGAGVRVRPARRESLRQSLLLSRGSFAILVERPIAAVLRGLTLALIAAPALSALRRVLRTGGVEGNG